MPAKPKHSTKPARTCRAYPTEVRRQAIAMHAEGAGSKRIGKALGIDNSVIKEWLRRYKTYGEESLQPFWRKPRAAKKPRIAEPAAPTASAASAVSETLHAKYGEVLHLYETTDLTVKLICEQAGVSLAGFKRYISLCHRESMLRRNGIEVGDGDAAAIRLRHKGTGQTLAGHRKYKAAIEACDDVKYIGYNVSQIAEKFSLDASAFGTQLRYHYPEVGRSREKERMRLGIGDNHHRGARPECLARYAAAIEMLRTTDKTIRQAADECGVSFSGLRVHLAQYHKEVVALRAERRDAARNSRKTGALNGIGAINRPRAENAERYREAVEMYRTTLLPLVAISERTNVPLTGLTYHLYRWHRHLVLRRKGMRPDGEKEYMDLSTAGRCLKSSKVKYAEAVRRLKSGEGESVAQVAAEFGFNPDTFRDYIRHHEPRLSKRFGQTKLKNGKTVLTRSSKKYEEAVRLYRSTTEPLKSIAQRLGLVYNSLGGFVRRNCPEAIGQHNALLARRG